MLIRLQRLFNWHSLSAFSTDNTFNIQSAQAKWKQLWPTFLKVPEAGKKFYCLVQFPYPSGNLHIGHARVYYISDAIARYCRLKGMKVVHPIGWDSFGLPAENAAISRKINPRTWTEQNISDMKEQLMKLGVWFDWHRELATHKPDYYRWTQQIFLQLYKRGLAYKKEAEVNWDPVDQTVLANEQIDANGNSWRSGAKVQKRRLSQWFFKITAYSDELNGDLAILDGWPDRVKQMQAGWIGAKKGHEVSFKIAEHEDTSKVGTSLKIFTTRVETIMGCTFVAVPVQNKEGRVVGKCLHPLTKEQLPIYEAGYVAEDFGTGAVMGVPAHDENDQQFAEQFKIPSRHILNKEQTHLVDSRQFSGLELAEARQKIESKLKESGLGHPQTHTHLRDWLVSRQRYWGAPIPVVYCDVCNIQPVPESDLPVLLPRSDLSQGNPLLHASFTHTKCPKCGGNAKRETDTLDTFVDSSWYFLRYLDPNNAELPFRVQLAEESLPVDVYIGGIEHAVMHLLYARFIYKVLHRAGFVGKVWREPFKELIVQGLVKGKTFKLKNDGRYVTPVQAKSFPSDQLITSFEKMSKSKFNGVNPTDVVDKFGCDALRLALLFSAPVENDIEFTEDEVERMQDFLSRVARLANKIGDKESYKGKDFEQITGPQKQMLDKLIELVQDIENCLERSYSMHVYAARIMQLFNLIREGVKSNSLLSSVLSLAFRILVVCMTPLSPHVSCELWERMPAKLTQLQAKMQILIKIDLKAPTKSNRWSGLR